MYHHARDHSDQGHPVMLAISQCPRIRCNTEAKNPDIPGKRFSESHTRPTACRLAPLMHAQNTLSPPLKGTSSGMLLCLLCNRCVRRRSSGMETSWRHHKQTPFLQRLHFPISLLEELSKTIADSIDKWPQQDGSVPSHSGHADSWVITHCASKFAYDAPRLSGCWSLCARSSVHQGCGDGCTPFMAPFCCMENHPRMLHNKTLSPLRQQHMYACCICEWTPSSAW